MDSNVHVQQRLRLAGRDFSPPASVLLWLGGATVLLASGIVLNWGLTAGHWVPDAYGDLPTRATSDSAPYYYNQSVYDLATSAILVVSILLLLGGFFVRQSGKHLLRASGFTLFGFYWATQAMRFYVKADGDFVNMSFAAFGTYFFTYFAYQSLLDRANGVDTPSLRWLAGTGAITSGVYFLTYLVRPVSEWLILTVAGQTQWLLQFFGQGTVRDGGSPDGSLIYYPTNPELGAFSGGWFPIQIILACTAIQSIMIFVGGILSIRPPQLGVGYSGKPQRFQGLQESFRRRLAYAFLLTVPLIYVLNLFRNVIIIWMSGQENAVLFSTNEAAFWFAHNIIGKGGSLVALIIIAFIVFRILPELYDAIIGLLDLTARKGPVEEWMRSHGFRSPLRRRAPKPAPTAVGPGAAPVAAQPVDPGGK